MKYSFPFLKFASQMAKPVEHSKLLLYSLSCTELFLSNFMPNFKYFDV